MEVDMEEEIGLSLRKAWHDRMLVEWEKNVQSDTKEGRQIITGYFDANGWSAWLRSQPGCENGYVRRRGSGVDYCGQILGAMGLDIGEHIRPGECLDIRLSRQWSHFMLPSTARMASKDVAARAGVELSKSLAAADVQPFDIITVNTGANKSYGDHFAIVHTVGPDSVVTLEGNASGMNVIGRRVHGVVMGKWSLKDIRRVYRLGVEVFDFGQVPYKEIFNDCASGECGTLQA